MWHVWHACGCLASFTERVCHVWQASHDALPCIWPELDSCFTSASLLRPIL